MELVVALAITLTQDQCALLVNVVKEKLWCPAFLTAFVKVSNSTSNVYFQNSPFFITLLLGLSYNNCILTKIEKKNIVLQKDNKYCNTEINHKIYFK